MRGPVFFRQERVGINGEYFSMIKFRSMVVDAETGWRRCGRSSGTQVTASCSS